MSLSFPEQHNSIRSGEERDSKCINRPSCLPLRPLLSPLLVTIPTLTKRSQISFPITIANLQPRTSSHSPPTAIDIFQEALKTFPPHLTIPMAPPRGPRGGGTRTARNNANPRPNRGGIQKRKNAGPKVDIDGDMDMDGEGRRAKRPAAGDTNSSKPSRPARSTGPASTKLPPKQAEALVRHLSGNNSLASRTSRRGQQKPQSGLAWLTVKGLKESKAASNPGGGVKDLLQFLERKATSMANRTSTRPIAIKQVRIAYWNTLGGARKRCQWFKLAP